MFKLSNTVDTKQGQISFNHMLPAAASLPFLRRTKPFLKLFLCGGFLIIQSL